MRNRVFLSTIIVGAIHLTFASSANAALVTFTNRVAWQAAAGGGVGDLFENFNSFGPEDSFYGTGAPISAGFLSFEVVNGRSDPSWRIDVPPPAAIALLSDVNGSPFATTFGIRSGGFGDTRISFAPIQAIGFDYSGADYSQVDGILATSLGGTVTIAKSGNANKAFIGFLYTKGETFSSLEWDAGPAGPGVDPAFGAGIDNVAAFTTVSAVVPLPAAVCLLGSALGGLGFMRRRLA